MSVHELTETLEKLLAGTNLSEQQAAEQEAIEKRLFAFRRGQASPQFFLYDVTSSYLEGDHNALADWGYNRDKKRGKQQIVIGLLCDEEGEPLSVEVFAGNTADLTRRLRGRSFRIRDVYGDRRRAVFSVF